MLFALGRSGNSIVNIVTKSGTNDYHGSLFFFERNRDLQALPATFDRDLPTPPFDREQLGGSVGGPLKKDKSWFFTSLEYRTQNAALETGARDFTTMRFSMRRPPRLYASISGRRVVTDSCQHVLLSFRSVLQQHSTLP